MISFFRPSETKKCVLRPGRIGHPSITDADAFGMPNRPHPNVRCLEHRTGCGDLCVATPTVLIVKSKNSLHGYGSEPTWFAHSVRPRHN